MSHLVTSRPGLTRLYDIVLGQEGMFTTKQAEQKGYSDQLIQHHLKIGNLIRVRRGIYRLAHFPAGDNEDLVAAWLWSEQHGIISHQTAMRIYELSDILPARIHITLPAAWKKRRLRVPRGIVTHHGDVPENDKSWFGAVPITKPARTLNDCAKNALAPDFLRQGAKQAIRRGLINRTELSQEFFAALRPFGGLGR